MKRIKTILLLMLLLLSLRPRPAYADFFGGDLPLLAEIVANTLQQVTQLGKILGTSQDSLRYIQEINQGLKNALQMAKTMNTRLSPGVLSELQGAEQALAMIQDLYGRIPRSSESRMQQTMDLSAAEAIHLHNEAFRYADQIDPEAERIKDHARVVSPQGAGKLTAQSIGVLIHVMNQVLRTNAAMLKLHSEQLALQNRREKLNSEQFKTQYEGLAKAFGQLKPNYRLSPLIAGH